MQFSRNVLVPFPIQRAMRCGLLFSLIACSTAWGQSPQLKIQWLGGPTAVITFNGMTLMTDPMLGSGDQAFWMDDPNQPFDLQQGPSGRYFKRYSPLPAVNIKQVDAVLLSHAHEDHFDQQAQQQLIKTLPIYLPDADTDKVREYGFKQLQPMKAGEQKLFKAGSGSITLTAIPADHSANPAMEPVLGQGLGYMMTFRQGAWSKNLYWSGDSLPTARVINALENHPVIDIALLNMGAVGTPGPLGLISMDSRQAIAMSKTIQAKKVVPIHHSTFDLYLEPIGHFVQLAERHNIAMDVISEGSTLLYD